MKRLLLRFRRKNRLDIDLHIDQYLRAICPPKTIALFNRFRRTALTGCFIQAATIFSSLSAQSKTDDLLRNMLNKNEHPVFRQVLSDPAGYRLQVIYTKIDRDNMNRPAFTNYYFNFNPNQYFNPASTVKLPLAILALEKLNSIRKTGVNKYTTIQFDSSYPGQKIACLDSTAEGGKPSIAQYIRKAFLISDNDAYNRLYQFVGQQMINRNLWSKGYKEVRITRQFMGFNAEQNRHTNGIRFLDKAGKLLYAQEPAYNRDSFLFPQTIEIGKAHYNAHDSLVNEPIDFTYANNLSLETLQKILQSALFPESMPLRQRFSLKADDYHFLRRFLSQFPSETNYPKYDTAKYYDSYVKFFFRDSTHKLPEGVRVFNKVGWAYGFLTDISYVADFTHHVEFMLSATLYVNSDGILNDNKYDYDHIGYPFLRELGKTVYAYELERKRAFTPRLGKFSIRYEKRDPNDMRPAIKDADN